MTFINSRNPNATTETTNVIPGRFSGQVTPIFRNVGGFDNLGAALNATPFALHASGGLISSSAGVVADGYRYLPQNITTITPTRTDWLIDWDTAETGASITLGIGPASTGYTVNIANTGGNVVATFTKYDGTTRTASGALTGRVNLSVSFASGNGGMTCSVQVLGTASNLATSNVWRVPQFEYQALNRERLGSAYFATNCTSSRIVGFLHNANGLDGDPNGVLLTRTAIMHLAGNTNGLSGTAGTLLIDHENVIIIPERASLETPLKVLMFFHGRSGYMTDAISATSNDNGETARQALVAGYAYAATQGGRGTENQTSDWWGNAAGLERSKEVYDVLSKWCSNVGKVYGFGWSMGGVCALNFARQHPDLCAALDLVTPVTDLEDSQATYGVQIQPSLKASIDLAYQRYWVSRIASNLNNNPTTDSGTNWKAASEPGAFPDIGFRSYQVTTTSAAVTSNVAVAVASSSLIPVGSTVYFRASRQSARVAFRAPGLPNTLQLDAAVTVLSGEPVCLVTMTPEGKPDARAIDFAWFNSQTSTAGAWSSGTSYGVGGFARKNSANPALDVRPWNPLRHPSAYNLPIRIGVAGNGLRTGNDGILHNEMMFAFLDAVNAVYAGKVTMRAPTGTAHVTGGLNAADTLNYFNLAS